MPGAPNIVDLRRLLEERFPQARPFRVPRIAMGMPTGIPSLDALLGGGLPKGKVTEMVGKGLGSGSAQVLHALMEQTARDGRFLALVDGADSLDIDAPSSRALSRLLWVRCRSADEALKAADLLVRDRNIPLLVLDLKLNPPEQLRRIASSVWHRFGRIVEHQGTTLVVLTPSALVGAASVRVEVTGGPGIESLRALPEEVVDRLTFSLRRDLSRGREADSPTAAQAS